MVLRLRKVVFMAKKQFDYVVTGFGADPATALREAEGKMPHPIKDPAEFYSGFETLGPTEMEVKNQDGTKSLQYKVEIAYSLRGKTPETKADAQKTRARPSTAGPGDPFACTRKLTDRL